jgi:hypothetical protein
MPVALRFPESLDWPERFAESLAESSALRCAAADSLGVELALLRSMNGFTLSPYTSMRMKSPWSGSHAK